MATVAFEDVVKLGALEFVAVIGMV